MFDRIVRCRGRSVMRWPPGVGDVGRRAARPQAEQRPPLDRVVLLDGVPQAPAIADEQAVLRGAGHGRVQPVAVGEEVGAVAEHHGAGELAALRLVRCQGVGQLHVVDLVARDVPRAATPSKEIQ